MDQVPRQILSDNLKRLRAERQWSQGDLARHAGMPTRTISAIELMTHGTSVDTLAKLGKAFGLPAWSLLIPHVESSAFGSDGLADVVTGYIGLPQESRVEIDRVAQREARYQSTPLKPR